MLHLDRTALRAIVEKFPAVSERILTQLVKRLRDAEDQIEVLMLRDTQSKVVSALLKMARGRDGAAELTMSPVDLSSRVGLDVDTVKRAVQRLRDQQYLRIVGELAVRRGEAAVRRTELHEDRGHHVVGLVVVLVERDRLVRVIERLARLPLTEEVLREIVFRVALDLGALRVRSRGVLARTSDGPDRECDQDGCCGSLEASLTHPVGAVGFIRPHPVSQPSTAAQQDGVSAQDFRSYPQPQ